MFDYRPDMLRKSERQLTYADLSEFQTLQEARESVLEKEVETVLRQSHKDHFVWLEKKLEIPLRKGLAVWPNFIELCERRNLFVHTNGVVSAQYIRNCREAKVDFDGKPPTPGTVLRAPGDYFMEACEWMLEIAVKLTHVLWRKLDPDDRESADGALNEVCHDLIADGREALALELLTFATDTIKTHSSEQARLYFLLNKAQALKWVNRSDECAALLAEEDWTAKGPSYQLAKAVLEDDFDQAGTIMRQIGPAGEVPKGAYSDWAIFREFRQSEEFASAFYDVFEEAFEVEEEAGPAAEEETATENEDAGDM